VTLLLLAPLLGLAACADPPGRPDEGDAAADSPDLDIAEPDSPDPADVLADATADAPIEPDVPAPPDAESDADAPDIADSGDCAPDEARCAFAGFQRCEAGRWSATVPCQPQEACYEGACLPRTCAPGAAGCLDEATLGICDATGTTMEPFTCPEPSLCVNARCVSSCAPSTLFCDGPDVVECAVDGRSFWVLETCDRERGFECFEGRCASGCDAITSKDQYIGCDFWGVDTPNEFGRSNRFAFVISNVDLNRTAHVAVEDRAGAIIEEVDIPPQQVATLRMPLPRTMNNTATSLANTGFHLLSDVPINAYQFNPLQRLDPDSEPVASNDASLLFPNNALGTEYIGVAFRHWGSYGSFLSIVSTADQNIVQITPSATVAGGISVDPINAGETATIELQRGQVLTLESLSAGTDLTGTAIVSTANVGVFGGVDCAQIPVGADYCDHIEETIVPLRAWDRTYYVSKFQPRGTETDVYRVVAATDGTTITTEPTVGPFPVLNRGEWYEFETTRDFELEASEPVLVVQYMKGSSQTGSADNGDPSMLTVVPARQYRPDYVFLVPDTYARDFINITFPVGATVILDDQPLSTATATPIGETGFMVLRSPISDGRHVLVSTEPVGLSVYGYDLNISYAYPAGLDLNAVR